MTPRARYSAPLDKDPLHVQSFLCIRKARLAVAMTSVIQRERHMTSNSSKTHRGLAGFFFLLVLAPPLAFVAAIPWLKEQQDGTVYLFSGLASASVIIASLVLAIMQDRETDEWTRAAARFSAHWGFVAGGCFLALLLALPPFRDGVTAAAGQLSETPVDETLVLVTFVAGFLSCMLAQATFTLILGAIWRAWMARSL